MVKKGKEFNITPVRVRQILCMFIRIYHGFFYKALKQYSEATFYWDDGQNTYKAHCNKKWRDY